MLKEILEVEAKIEQIKKNKTYMKLQKNLNILKGVGFGKTIVTIPSGFRTRFISIKDFAIISS